LSRQIKRKIVFFNIGRFYLNQAQSVQKSSAESSTKSSVKSSAESPQTKREIKREIKRGAYPSVAPGDDDAARASKVEARALVVQTASLGETIVFFAQGLSGQSGSPTKMAELLKDASVQNDARFAEDVKAITGPQGVLSKPPFGIAASRFADK
jgi:hypothetical protein